MLNLGSAEGFGQGGRCDTCPLGRLDAAEQSEAGRLLRRALDLRAASRMGIHVTLDDIAADEVSGDGDTG